MFDVAPFLLFSLSRQYYLCHYRTMVGSLRVQNIREKRNRRLLRASLSVFARALAFVCSYVVETLRRLVGRPRLLLAAAYLEFLLKLTYERRIGLVVQVASHHERLSAFLCRLLNDAYLRNAVGFGQREVGRCKYEVVELRHKQRSCLLASRQRILSDAYRTLAREYADAVFAAF